MNKVTVSAKTVEEAVDIALKQLNAKRENVKVKVLQEASRGFLGLIGSREAEAEVSSSVRPTSRRGRVFMYGGKDGRHR